MQGPLSVLIIDDHPIYSEGLIYCLRSLGIVGRVDSCSNYIEAVDKMREGKPHLIFLEVNIETRLGDAFQVCRDIKSQYRNSFIAMISSYRANQVIKMARESGANAIINKRIKKEILYEFMHKLYCGEITEFYTDIKPRPKFTACCHVDSFELKQRLTRRELELMNLILAGKERQEIESRMCISYETYRFHHNNLLSKLTLKNDIQLMHFALDNNWNFSDT